MQCTYNLTMWRVRVTFILLQLSYEPDTSSSAERVLMAT